MKQDTNRGFVNNGSLALHASPELLILKRLLKSVTVYGGPGDNPPINAMPVVFLKERLPAILKVPGIANELIHLPVQDFNVPDDKDLPKVEQALFEAMMLSERHAKMFVCCGAGIGRTGMFLSLMAKVAGVFDPIKYVRNTYMRGAVETAAQMTYIETFNVEPVRRRLIKALIRKRLEHRFPWLVRG